MPTLRDYQNLSIEKLEQILADENLSPNEKASIERVLEDKLKEKLLGDSEKRLSQETRAQPEPKPYSAPHPPAVVIPTRVNRPSSPAQPITAKETSRPSWRDWAITFVVVVVIPAFLCWALWGLVSMLREAIFKPPEVKVNISTSVSDLMIDSSDISDNYSYTDGGSIPNDEVAKTDENPSELLTKLRTWGRIDGYFQEYVHELDCDFKDGVQHFVVNAALYKNADGAKQAVEFFAQDDKLSAITQTRNYQVGDEAYSTWYESSNGCEPSDTTRIIRLRFRKYNVSASVYMSSVKGSISDDYLLEQAVRFAKLVELKIESAVNK